MNDIKIHRAACGCSGSGGGALRDEQLELEALVVFAVGFRMLVMRESRMGGLVGELSIS